MPHVLVVEDSPTQATQIKLMLEDAEFQVTTAGNGMEAVDAIEKELPDVVVTDLEMPRMNGLQLVEAIRQQHPALPVILMTAFGSEEIAALALRKGAASYVQKTYLEQDLVATLKSVLTVTQASREHDRALECLAQMECDFVLDNNPEHIAPVIGFLDEVVKRLTVPDPTERMRIGVALQEALMNAMVHGNLEVGPDNGEESGQPIAELIETRRQQQPYLPRRVRLLFKANSKQASFVVRDEGRGFDPSILPDPTDPANLERPNGRGLLLIRTFMDTIYHNDVGNEITMIKHRTNGQYH